MIMFIKQAYDVAVLKRNYFLLLSNTSIFYSKSEVDDAHLFVAASINTFSGNKSCYRAFTNCFILFQ